MDIYSVFNLLLRKIRLILVVPVLAGALLFFLTRNQPKEYTASGTLFTAITSSSSLEDLGKSRVDFFATKTAYNNLITILNSRKVIEETSLRMLTKHLMLAEPEATIISETSYSALQEIVPSAVKQLIVPGNEEQTYLNFADYMHQDKTNFLYGLFNLNHPHYSYKAISNIKTVQVSGSDVIELSYSSNDAAIAYLTLQILIDVFLENYALLKKNQTDAVVEYFERQLKASSAELNDAEDRLLNFNKSNSIINYYEQTKHISSQQEKIQIKLQDIRLDYDAAEAVLFKLEAETQSRFNINLKNKEILDLRKALIQLNKELAKLEIMEADSLANSPQKIALKKERVQKENRLASTIDSLYVYQRNSDGIAIQTLLNDWLKTVIEYESAKARLLAMQKKNEEFKQLYNTYAPLGAILKRIEREIEVKEKAYLEILHHLGLAKLKQQNEEMMAKMKVLDKPQVPIDAQPTKRKVLVAVAVIFSMMLTVLGLFVFELLDKTIKSAERFQKLSAIPVIGAVLNSGKSSKLTTINPDNIQMRPILQAILKNIEGNSSNGYVIQVLSLWDREGKTGLVKKLQEHLLKLGLKVEMLHGSIEENPISNSYQQIIKDNTENGKSTIYLSEVPAVGNHVIAPALLNSANLSLLVADACRAWSKADAYILDELKSQLTKPLLGVLTQVFPHHVEALTGDLPKRRSGLRRYLKQRIVKRIL